MDYRELIFYQRAQEVLQAVNNLIKNWSNSMQAQEISRQLFRAAISVGANIAEGHGRHIGREYIHYLYIAQGSANEVNHWLHTAEICNLGSDVEILKINNLNDETRKMIGATIRSINKQYQIKEDFIPCSHNPFEDESSYD